MHTNEKIGRTERISGTCTETIAILFAFFLTAWIHVMISSDSACVVDSKAGQKRRKFWTCGEASADFAFE